MVHDYKLLPKLIFLNNRKPHLSTMKLNLPNHRLAHIFCCAMLLFFIFSTPTFAQVQVGVTVDSGNATTTCNDVFSGPDPLWKVRIGTGAWEVYSNNNEENCFGTYPNLQWSFPFGCAQDMPTSLQVCFAAYENDGILPCTISETCLEEICQNFTVPAPNNIANYTLSLPAGGDSGGEFTFTIGAIGEPFDQPNNGICDAENLGILTSGITLGDASLGGYNNLCNDNVNDISPSTDGAWINNQGVWFEFTTSATPGYEITINTLNDPLNLGDIMNLELAIYTSSDGTCGGDLELLDFINDSSDFDESITLTCLEANTTYYILVDGNDFGDQVEGFFGIEVLDNGAVPAPNLKCDALDLGMIPVGGVASVENVHNECADNVGDPFQPSAFISQKSVWFTFQAPPSGSVLVEAQSVEGAPWNNGIGAQVAVYRSFTDVCTGFFIEVGSSFTIADNSESLELNCLEPGKSYWILVDGSGSNTAGMFNMVVTDTENYPPQTTVDTTICFGTNYIIGTSNYTTTDNYTYVFNLPNGCDSTVFTNLTIAEELVVDALQTTLASSATAANGAILADVNGGTAPYTFLWSNSVTTAENENIPAGNYCVTVTDAIGCTAEACVLLEFSLISATATGDALDCFGDTQGEIAFSAQDGVPPYMYTYSDAAGTITGSGTIAMDGTIVIVDNLPAGNYRIDIEDVDGNTTFATTMITQPDEISSVQDFVLCFGKSIVIGNTTYDLSGNFSEILTAANGCDSLVTGMIMILPDPAFAIDTLICFGESLMVGNSIYTASGNYVDTLLSATNCDSIISTNLTVLDEINLAIVVNTLPTAYDAADGIAAVQASGGTGSFTYEWSDGQTSATAIGLRGGSEYCVTVTDDNGCSQEICDTILYESNIGLAFNDTLNCNGFINGQITLVVGNGLGDYNYVWENSGSGESGVGLISGNFGTGFIDNLGQGNYSITLSDTYVSTTLSAAVIEPAPLSAEIITALDITCVTECDASVLVEPAGGTAPYTYEWSGGIAPVQEPTNLCATFYSVTVTDANGCITVTAINIPEPAPIAIEISEIASISCGGVSDGILEATITGGTGTTFEFLWSNGVTQNVNTELRSENYTLTVTDEVGCSAIATYDLGEPVPVSFDLNITDVNCFNGLNSGSVSIENAAGGTGNYLYALGQGAFSSQPIFANLASGSYQVYVEDDNGCVESQTALVAFPDEVTVNLGDDYEINLGETVELEVFTSSNNAQIEWNVDTCQACPSFEVTPIFSTNYTVNVLDTLTGCSASDEISVFVSRERKVFIPNAFSPNSDGWNDYFGVFADAKSVRAIRNFRVFNRWGALVFEKDELLVNEETEGWDGWMNGKRMQNGVYIYAVEIEFIDGEVEVFKGDVTITE